MAGFPVATYNFRIQSGDIKIDASEVSGLSQDFQVLEYRDSEVADLATMKRPGLMKTSEIVIKHGIIKGDNAIRSFLNEDILNKSNYASGKDDSGFKTLIIELLDEKGAVVYTWNAAHPVPIKFTGAELKADQNQIAFESITFAHMGLKIS